MYRAASHPLTVSSTPSHNAMEPNLFLDKKDLNLTYLPHSHEVAQPSSTHGLPLTIRENSKLPLTCQFHSISSHSSTSESITKNCSTVYLLAGNATIHGRADNAPTNFSARDSANFTPLTSRNSS